MFSNCGRALSQRHFPAVIWQVVLPVGWGSCWLLFALGAPEILQHVTPCFCGSEACDGRVRSLCGHTVCHSLVRMPGDKSVGGTFFVLGQRVAHHVFVVRCDCDARRKRGPSLARQSVDRECARSPRNTGWIGVLPRSWRKPCP